MHIHSNLKVENYTSTCFRSSHLYIQVSFETGTRFKVFNHHDNFHLGGISNPARMTRNMVSISITIPRKISGTNLGKNFHSLRILHYKYIDMIQPSWYILPCRGNCQASNSTHRCLKLSGWALFSEVLSRPTIASITFYITPIGYLFEFLKF